MGQCWKDCLCINRWLGGRSGWTGPAGTVGRQPNPPSKCSSRPLNQPLRAPSYDPVAPFSSESLLPTRCETASVSTRTMRPPPLERFAVGRPFDNGIYLLAGGFVHGLYVLCNALKESLLQVRQQALRFPPLSLTAFPCSSHPAACLTASWNKQTACRRPRVREAQDSSNCTWLLGQFESCPSAATAKLLQIRLVNGPV